MSLIQKAYPLIGDGQSLTLETGDGCYVLKNALVHSWNISITNHMPDFFTRAHPKIQDITAYLTIKAFEGAWYPGVMPQKIEQYSITDMLRMINAQLKEREE
ncbi:hypothetical protein LCGC14_2683030 [marine sediment metagenome]|uniref:Uncharacterized protein n=1 Tax=marine sediment metagenome TaxID=412755 RepID=A0A0F8ZKV1_9ZZZZ